MDLSFKIPFSFTPLNKSNSLSPVSLMFMSQCARSSASCYLHRSAPAVPAARYTAVYTKEQPSTLVSGPRAALPDRYPSLPLARDIIVPPAHTIDAFISSYPPFRSAILALRKRPHLSYLLRRFHFLSPPILSQQTNKPVSARVELPLKNSMRSDVSWPTRAPRHVVVVLHPSLGIHSTSLAAHAAQRDIKH